jgi:hypothetical protein
MFVNVVDGRTTEDEAAVAAGWLYPAKALLLLLSQILPTQRYSDVLKRVRTYLYKKQCVLMLAAANPEGYSMVDLRGRARRVQSHARWEKVRKASTTLPRATYVTGMAAPIH